jgi:hypothetical protein
MNKCKECEKELTGNKKMYCSNACKQKQHYHKVKEQPNTYHAQTIRAYSRKLELIKNAGGCCIICGYNKNMSALEFHHRDPNGKDGGLDSRLLANRSIEYIIKEVEKCDLLCANCHRETHNPELDMTKLFGLIEQVKENSLENTRVGKPKCCDCDIEINYGSKRCNLCNYKYRTSENKPSIEDLKIEHSENGVTWCSLKYGVSRKTINRWLKKD